MKRMILMGLIGAGFLGSLAAPLTAAADPWDRDPPWEHRPHWDREPPRPNWNQETVVIFGPPPPPPQNNTTVIIQQPTVVEGRPIGDPYQAASGEYCREYQTTITVNNETVPAYGTACQQPDGSWKRKD